MMIEPILNLVETIEQAQAQLEKPSESNEWETPKDLFDAANEKWGPFVLDVAANGANAKTDVYLDKDSDSLKHAWDDIVRPGEAFWCNPPYSRGNKPAFVGKSRLTVACSQVRGVCLVPANTAETWFRDHVWRGADVVGGGNIDHGPLRGRMLRMVATDVEMDVLFLGYRVGFLFDGKETSGSRDSSVLVAFKPRRR